VHAGFVGDNETMIGMFSRPQVGMNVPDELITAIVL